VGALISEIRSQVRTSFIPAGEGGGGARDSGVGIAPSHTWTGGHSPCSRPGPSLPAPRHRPTGEGVSGCWEGTTEGAARLRLPARGRAEGAPQTPLPGVSPPNFPLARAGLPPQPPGSSQLNYQVSSCHDNHHPAAEPSRVPGSGSECIHIPLHPGHEHDSPLLIGNRWGNATPCSILRPTRPPATVRGAALPPLCPALLLGWSQNPFPSAENSRGEVWGSGETVFSPSAPFHFRLQRFSQPRPRRTSRGAERTRTGADATAEDVF